MNKNELEQKYGISINELQNLHPSKIKNLKHINKIKLQEDKKFKLISSGIKTIVKGSSIGMGIAGTINTIFPNAFSSLSSLYIGRSNLSLWKQITTSLFLSTSPVQTVSGLMITGIGAFIGGSLYTTYKLIKTGLEIKEIKKDLKIAKTMSLENNYQK